MNSDPASLLSHWFATGLPHQSHSAGHGLEWVIDNREVTDPIGLRTWLETTLRESSGRNDAIFIASAFEARTDAELQLLDNMCRDYCAAHGRSIQAIEQTRAMQRILIEEGFRSCPDFAFPVAVGHAAALNKMPLDMTLRFYLQSLCSNLSSAAALRPEFPEFGQQQIVLALRPVIEQVAKLAINLCAVPHDQPAYLLPTHQTCLVNL